MKAEITNNRFVTVGKDQFFEVLFKTGNIKHAVREQMPPGWPFLDAKGNLTISRSKLNAYITEIDDRVNLKIKAKIDAYQNTTN